jgi:hypothetical protein
LCIISSKVLLSKPIVFTTWRNEIATHYAVHTQFQMKSTLHIWKCTLPICTLCSLISTICKMIITVTNHYNFWRWNKSLLKNGDFNSWVLLFAILKPEFLTFATFGLVFASGLPARQFKIECCTFSCARPVGPNATFLTADSIFCNYLLPCYFIILAILLL